MGHLAADPPVRAPRGIVEESRDTAWAQYEQWREPGETRARGHLRQLHEMLARAHSYEDYRYLITAYSCLRVYMNTHSPTEEEAEIGLLHQPRGS